mmetsp:Transcript_66723/g.145511  ORF Transcript_66723/g.145511 Transcript_66723/m.145511 type:complete len:438 (+) Transcript_66723:121-1434(+)
MELDPSLSESLYRSPGVTEGEELIVRLLSSREVVEHGLSKWQAIVTIFNCMVGASVLALPYAMDHAGLIGFLALFGVSCVMGFTAFLIGKNLSIVARRPEGLAVPVELHDWSLIGKIALGSFGQNLISVMFLMDLSSCLITFLIATGINLPLLLPDGLLSTTMATIAAGLIAFLLLYVPVRLFAYFSMLGIIAQISMFVFLLITGIYIAEEDESRVGRDLRPGHLSALAAMLGCYIGCFNAHSTIPTIYQNVGDKTQWAVIIVYSMVMAFSFYFVVGAVGYAAFGDSVRQAFTANLGRDDSGTRLRGLEFLAPVCAAMISTKMLVTVPAMSRPILAFADARMPRKRFFFIFTRVLLITLLTVLSVLGRNLLPYVTAIRGAVVQVVISIVMPFAAYISLSWNEFSKTKRVLLLGFMVMSYLLTVPGAIVDVRIIISGG